MSLLDIFPWDLINLISLELDYHCRRRLCLTSHGNRSVLVAIDKVYRRELRKNKLMTATQWHEAVLDPDWCQSYDIYYYNTQPSRAAFATSGQPQWLLKYHWPSLYLVNILATYITYQRQSGHLRLIRLRLGASCFGEAHWYEKFEGTLFQCIDPTCKCKDIFDHYRDHLQLRHITTYRLEPDDLNDTQSIVLSIKEGDRWRTGEVNCASGRRFLEPLFLEADISACHLQPWYLPAHPTGNPYLDLLLEDKEPSECVVEIWPPGATRPLEDIAANRTLIREL